MKKYIVIFLFILIRLLSFAQDKNSFADHQLSFDFGSFRNNYLFAITDIKYSSPVLKKFNIKFSTRLRSYGTLYFYSKSAYDITPLAEYYFTKAIKPFYFSAGVGLDTRIRIVKDERSEATSSAEPLICFAAHIYYKKLSFYSPLWTRFYSNGVSFSLLPEMHYRFGKSFSIFARYELSYLSVYKQSSHEWRQDNFIGTQILF